MQAQPSLKHSHPPCPHCGSGHVHSSKPRTPGERLAHFADLHLRRCHNCDFRFLTARDWIVAATTVRTVELSCAVGLGLAAIVLLRILRG